MEKVSLPILMQTILASLFEKLNHFIYICDLKSRYSHWLPSFSHFPLPFSGISFQMDYLYPSSCFKQEESKPRDTAFHSTSFQWWHKSWEKTVVMVLSFWLGANVPHFDLHKNCFRKGKKNLKKPPQLLAYFLNVIFLKNWIIKISIRTGEIKWLYLNKAIGQN